MMLTFVFILLMQMLSESSGSPYTGVCNKPVNCPKIKADCQLNQFTIGSDNTTRCPACAKNVCGSVMDVCPVFDVCPNPPKPNCGKPNFIIGRDGITKCRMCDINVCVACPHLNCLELEIPEGCIPKKSYTIGLDGITLCPACDNIDYCKKA